MSDDLLAPRDAPELPGLIFRRFRGEADFPGMVAVRNACMAVDGLEWPENVADVARAFLHLTNCDPQQDVIYAELKGKTIGFGQAIWYQQADGTRLYHHWGFVTPGRRRLGVGSAILGWLEDRQRAIAATHPQDGPRFHQAECYDSETARTALLERHDYAVARRWYQMTRPLDGDIPDAPLPDGLEVRPVMPDHYRQIWDADVEAFRDHWGYAEPKEEDYQSWLDNPVEMQTELWQVAWDGNRIAGQVRNLINHEENAQQGRLRGYTEEISVHRPYRRRGLATALIMRSLRVLKEQGMTEAALGVDAENTSGALRLYERCGYRVAKSGAVHRKPTL